MLTRLIQLVVLVALVAGGYHVVKAVQADTPIFVRSTLNRMDTLLEKGDAVTRDDVLEKLGQPAQILNDGNTWRYDNVTVMFAGNRVIGSVESPRLSKEKPIIETAKPVAPERVLIERQRINTSVSTIEGSAPGTGPQIVQSPTRVITREHDRLNDFRRQDRFKQDRFSNSFDRVNINRNATRSLLVDMFDNSRDEENRRR